MKDLLPAASDLGRQNVPVFCLVVGSSVPVDPGRWQHYSCVISGASACSSVAPVMLLLHSMLVTWYHLTKGGDNVVQSPGQPSL